MVIKFSRIKEVLKAKSFKDFCKFMEGQTISVDGVYEDDFFKWIMKYGVVD